MGCTQGHGGDDSTDPTDTGITSDCPVDVHHLTALVCVESTSPVGTSTTEDSGGYPGNSAGSITGTVSEVGPPTSLPGSAAVPSFHDCGDAERIVRIVDGAGDTWTIGWSLEGDSDLATADLVAPGDPAELTWSWQFYAYSASFNAVLSDADGPRFVFDGGLDVAPELIEGLAVGLGNQQCTWVEGSEVWDETPIVFGGTLTLYSGQSGTVPLADRSLDVVVPGSAWPRGCADGCGIQEWVGWKSGS